MTHKLKLKPWRLKKSRIWEWVVRIKKEYQYHCIRSVAVLFRISIYWKNMNVANASSLVWRGWRRVYGLQVAQREIPKYNSRIREWYLKVKDIVYQLEDLFEDIELQVMAESYDSPSLSKDKFEELLKDDGLDSCIHLILFLLLLLLLPLLIILLLPHQH